MEFRGNRLQRSALFSDPWTWMPALPVGHPTGPATTPSVAGLFYLVPHRRRYGTRWTAYELLIGSLTGSAMLRMEMHMIFDVLVPVSAVLAGSMLVLLAAAGSDLIRHRSKSAVE
jgi:hypothetical protein